jgi:hypothetical protein
MTCSVRLIRCALAFLLLACLDGCLPSSQSQMEEEKEPHFLAGKSCINNMDYKGAIDEFEKALEANPHSASAHFQLGWLYEEKEPDPAAAIYHYEQFLKLRPNSDNAEVIAQHITNCKQDLAKTVLPLPVTPGMQGLTQAACSRLPALPPPQPPRTNRRTPSWPRKPRRHIPPTTIFRPTLVRRKPQAPPTPTWSSPGIPSIRSPGRAASSSRLSSPPIPAWIPSGSGSDRD